MNLEHKYSLDHSVWLQYTQCAHSLSVLLYLSLQDKLMSLMRIKTEGGGKQGGKEKEGGGGWGRQSDVALPSLWQ